MVESGEGGRTGARFVFDEDFENEDAAEHELGEATCARFALDGEGVFGG